MTNMPRIDSSSAESMSGEDSRVRLRSSSEGSIEPTRVLQISVEAVPLRWHILEILSRSQVCARSSLFLFCQICEYL